MTYNIVDLESTPDVVVLRVEVGKLREVDDEIVDALGLQRVRDGLCDQHGQHDGNGVR